MILVEDAGDRIVLQHILVAPGGFVTKHWADGPSALRGPRAFLGVRASQPVGLRPFPRIGGRGGMGPSVYSR